MSYMNFQNLNAAPSDCKYHQLCLRRLKQQPTTSSKIQGQRASVITVRILDRCKSQSAPDLLTEVVQREQDQVFCACVVIQTPETMAPV